MFARLQPEAKTPDIQFHVATLSADMAGGQVHDFSGMTFSVCQLRPQSRGSIALASADPFDRPLIHANYLAAESDRQFAVASIGFARKLAHTPPLSDYIAAEVTPGPEIASDDDILHFAQANGATIFHPAGTCRMGPDEDAVVDRTIARARRRPAVGGRLLDHADAGVGQYQRAGDDDRGKSSRSDPARRRDGRRLILGQLPKAVHATASGPAPSGYGETSSSTRRRVSIM